MSEHDSVLEETIVEESSMETLVFSFVGKIIISSVLFVFTLQPAWFAC